MQNQKIIVIGAGLAGLTAAYRLYQKGFNVEVYEARSRVGGRVFSATIDDRVIELGGENFLSRNDAPNVSKLADECGLEIIEKQKQLNHYYFGDGKNLVSIRKLLKEKNFDSEKLQIQLYELAGKSENMKEVLDQLFNSDDVLYKSMRFFLSAYEGASIEKLSTFYVKTLYYMLLGGMCASNENDTPIGYATIKGGNGLLPEKLYKYLGSRVNLSTSLVAVEKKEDGRYLLTFNNRHKAEADIIVFAMPCTVYNDINFGEGVIPEARLAAIKKVGYGTNAKIIIPLTYTSDMNIVGDSDRFEIFTDSFANFFNIHQKALNFYCVNQSSFFNSETVAERYHQVNSLVTPVFKNVDFTSFVPTYARDESFATYHQVAVGHSWPNDPFVKGSYSHIAAGQKELLTAVHEEAGEQVRTFYASIDGKLYFAGEHATLLLDMGGTMEAACESGERVARIIEKNFNA